MYWTCWLQVHKILEKPCSFDASKKSKEEPNSHSLRREPDKSNTTWAWWIRILLTEGIPSTLSIWLGLLSSKGTNTWEKLNNLPKLNGKITDSGPMMIGESIAVYTLSEGPESNKAIWLSWDNSPYGLILSPLSPSLTSTSNRKFTNWKRSFVIAPNKWEYKFLTLKNSIV